MPGEVQTRYKEEFFFLTVGMVRHWDRLPREVADVLCLSVLKRPLDNALSSML